MPKQESIVERAIDKIKPQPNPPSKPPAPSSDRREWHESVERHHVAPGLTVRDVGLSVFGETRSFKDRPGSNESIDAARQKLVHAMINDAELSHSTGKRRNSVHDPVEPTEKELRNRDEKAAYDSSMLAAREAYLSGHDPTRGATHLRFRPTPDRSNWKFENGTKEGLSISTQSGPYDNSYLKGDVRSPTVWINTYLPDANDLKPHHRDRRR